MKISRAFRYTLIFAMAGLITIILVIYVQRNLLNTYSRNLSYVTLADNIKNRSTHALASFEELLEGDTKLDLEKDVIVPLTESLQILQGAYDGNETELGFFEKPKDEETRAILKEAIIDNEKLITSVSETWESQNQLASTQPLEAATDSIGNVISSVQVSPTGDLNQHVGAYQKLQDTLTRLDTLVKNNTNADTTSLTMLSWVCILIVIASFGLLCVLIYSFQKNSDTSISDQSKKLEEETKRVGTLTRFIETVSAGNYNIDVQSHAGDDTLATMLVNMRDKLRQTAEDDRKRNWTTTGLAQVGEILRASTRNISELSDNIIKFVVKYTKSNQGGLFILNNDTPDAQYLELVACYAFERKKYLTKRVEIGDGLIGQCYLEGERIYLTEVPDEYIFITSGLGSTNPKAVLIVPLKVNDKVYGAIELASLNAFEDFEIELVEKLAESIASTISTVKVNETTRILLEQTQQQGEEMKSQEEEIRQNMEELEATQEEMRRKQTILEKELQQSQQQAEILRLQEKRLTESQDTLQAIVDNIPRAIFWKDKDLRFMGCNKIFAAIAGANSPKELIGKSDFDMAWSAQADAYRKDDMEVMRKRQSKLDIEEVNINSEGEESWVLTSKVPILSQDDKVVAILGMFEDITARKRKEADIARKLQEREAALKELQELRQMLETRKV